jgi:hypothetical protein
LIEKNFLIEKNGKNAYIMFVEERLLLRPRALIYLVTL